MVINFYEWLDSNDAENILRNTQVGDKQKRCVTAC
nr:MAG TPA: hypothetical protein [Caudoviricetes sp.]